MEEEAEGFFLKLSLFDFLFYEICVCVPMVTVLTSANV